MEIANSYPSNKFAWIGGLFILPALYFVCAAVLEAYLGISTFTLPLQIFYATPQSLSICNTVSPILFLGGILIGALLSLDPNPAAEDKPHGSEIEISLRVKTGFWNLVILATGLALFSLMIAYALAEIFGPGL